MTESEDCIFSIDSSQRDETKDPLCTSFHLLDKSFHDAIINENIQMHLKEFQHCQTASGRSLSATAPPSQLHLFTKALPIPHNTSIQVYVKNQLRGTWIQLLRLCLPATLIKCKLLQSHSQPIDNEIILQCCAEDQQHYLTEDWIAHLQQYSTRPVLLYCGRIDESAAVCKIQLVKILNSNQVVARLQFSNDYLKLKRTSGSFYCYLYIPPPTDITQLVQWINSSYQEWITTASASDSSECTLYCTRIVDSRRSSSLQFSLTCHSTNVFPLEEYPLLYSSETMSESAKQVCFYYSGEYFSDVFAIDSSHSIHSSATLPGEQAISTSTSLVQPSFVRPTIYLSPFCHICEKEEASIYCEECNRVFCQQQCHTCDHRFSQYEKHKLYSIPQWIHSLTSTNANNNRDSNNRHGIYLWQLATEVCSSYRSLTLPNTTNVNCSSLEQREDYFSLANDNEKAEGKQTPPPSPQTEFVSSLQITLSSPQFRCEFLASDCHSTKIPLLLDHLSSVSQLPRLVKSSLNHNSADRLIQIYADNCQFHWTDELFVRHRFALKHGHYDVNEFLIALSQGFQAPPGGCASGITQAFSITCRHIQVTAGTASAAFGMYRVEITNLTGQWSPNANEESCGWKQFNNNNTCSRLPTFQTTHFLHLPGSLYWFPPPHPTPTATTSSNANHTANPTIKLHIAPHSLVLNVERVEQQPIVVASAKYNSNRHLEITFHEAHNFLIGDAYQAVVVGKFYYDSIIQDPTWTGTYCIVRILDKFTIESSQQCPDFNLISAKNQHLRKLFMQQSNRICVNVAPEFLIGADTDSHDLIQCKPLGDMTNLSSEWCIQTASAASRVSSTPSLVPAAASTASTIQLRVSAGKISIKYFISYSSSRKPIILGKQILHHDEDEKVQESRVFIQVFEKNGNPLEICFPEFTCTFYGENCINKNNNTILSESDIEEWIR